jgi:hypothetical protein
MDDLDIIRLAVREIISKRRIAREGMDVKGKFGKRTEMSKAGYLAGFSPSTSYGLPQELA